MAEWRRSTWGEEISLEYGKSLRDYTDFAGPVRVYGANGPIGWTTTPLASGPGVILGRKGEYRGVEFSAGPFFVIDTAYFVLPKTELDMRWIYYAIIFHNLGKIDDGSPVPSTTRAAVYPLPLKVPPLPEQQAIASVLGALDDAIEQNSRTSRVLERLARAIFRGWFVDFEPVYAKAGGAKSFPSMPQAVFDALPSRFVDSELGSVPKGWELVSLGEVATATKGLSYKGAGLVDADKRSAGDLPLHNLNSIYEGGGYKLRGVKYYAGDFKPRHVLQAGDLIIANTEQGFDYRLIGFPAIVPRRFGERGLFTHHIYRSGGSMRMYQRHNRQHAFNRWAPKAAPLFAFTHCYCGL